MATFTPALAYHVLTPAYDAVTAVLGFGRPFAEDVARHAAVTVGESVLDLGCGTGRLLRALIARQPAAHYMGLDPDPHILAIARRRLSGLDQELEVVNGYAQDLPFGDDRFDLVVSTLVFHHMPDPAKRAALREVARVLRPTGRFLLVDFGQPATWMSRALPTIGSLFDGRQNMRANLAGELPAMLSHAELDVTELRPPFRGVRYLLARPRLAGHSHRA